MSYNTHLEHYQLKYIYIFDPNINDSNKNIFKQNFMSIVLGYRNWFYDKYHTLLKTTRSRKTRTIQTVNLL